MKEITYETLLKTAHFRKALIAQARSSEDTLAYFNHLGLTEDQFPNQYGYFRMQIAEADTALQEADDLIGKIQDPFIRKCVKLRYYHELPWNQICMKMYGYADNSTCRKSVWRYFRLEK